MRARSARSILRGAGGFTLVELLVVLLLLAILATIALPAFIGQRAKGQDTEAQAALRTVALALAAHHADEDTYDATKAELIAIEPAIGEATPYLDIDGDAESFTIKERSASDTEFTLARAADGTVTRSCTVPERGLCRTGGAW
jgi:prepilin-type N-terminal cleavage/methylation domain-containing protein